VPAFSWIPDQWLWVTLIACIHAWHVTCQKSVLIFWASKYEWNIFSIQDVRNDINSKCMSLVVIIEIHIVYDLIVPLKPLWIHKFESSYLKWQQLALILTACVKSCGIYYRLSEVIKWIICIFYQVWSNWYKITSTDGECISPCISGIPQLFVGNWSNPKFYYHKLTSHLKHSGWNSFSMATTRTISFEPCQPWRHALEAG